MKLILLVFNIFLTFSIQPIAGQSLSYFWRNKNRFPTTNEFIKAQLHQSSSSKIYQIEQFIFADQGYVYSEIRDENKFLQIYYFNTSQNRLIIKGDDVDLIPYRSFMAYYDLNGDKSIMEGLMLLGPFEALQSVDGIRCYSRLKTTEKHGTLNVKVESNLCSQGSSIVRYFSDDPSIGDDPLTIDIEVTNRGIRHSFGYDIFYRTNSMPKINYPLPIGLGISKMTSQKVNFIRMKTSLIRFTLTSYDLNLVEPLKREILYDKRLNFLRSESLKKEEAIVYDFRLGIEYAFEYRKNQMICNIQPLNADHLQLIIGLFNHNSPRILIPNLPEFDYFGRTQCIQESNQLCDTWELTTVDKTFDKVNYDLFVVTIKAIPQAFDAHIPFSLELNGFNLKDPKEDRYEKVFWRKTIISEISEALFESEFESKFNIKFCFDDLSDHQSYTLLLKSVSDKDVHNLETFNNIKQNFLEALFNLSHISTIRVPEVEVSSTNDQKILKLEMLLLPPAANEKSFSSREVFVPKKLLKSLNEIKSSSLVMCTTLSITGNVKEFIFCDQEKPVFCALLYSPNTKFTSKSIDSVKCTLYTNMAENVKNLYDERPSSLAGHVLSSLIEKSPFIVDQKLGNKFEIINYFRSNQIHSQISDIIPIAKLTSQSDNFIQLQSTSWSKCYSKCVSSDEAPCSLFSFCSIGKDDEDDDKNNGKCLLSSSHYSISNREIITQIDKKCTTHLLTAMSAFDFVESGLFEIDSQSSHIFGANSEYCADKCFNDDSCTSFAICEKKNLKQCFNFNITRAKVISSASNFCTFYQAKSTRLFNQTSSKLADEIFATYKNVPFKRCAQFCESSKETNCQSFNYCHNRNECQLASSTSRQAIKSVDNKDCFYYENINLKSFSSSFNRQINDETFSVSFFVIIFTFFLIGLITGFVGFNVYQAVWIQVPR